MAKKISIVIILITLALLLVSERMSYTSSMELLRGSLEQRVTTIDITTARRVRGEFRIWSTLAGMAAPWHGA